MFGDLLITALQQDEGGPSQRFMWIPTFVLATLVWLLP